MSTTVGSMWKRTEVQSLKGPSGRLGLGICLALSDPRCPHPLLCLLAISRLSWVPGRLSPTWCGSKHEKRVLFLTPNWQGCSTK